MSNLPTNLSSKPTDEDIALYTWFKLETGLKSYLRQKMSSIPSWAISRGVQTTEQLHRAYQERLAYEFSIVKKMGFLGYFLIVADMIAFCRKQGIPTGPGRGSGAGSLIGFLLRITTIDPIRYNLLFERFLNPDRYSMPDYDCDISQEKRHLVKEHFVNKYGSDRVASIGTFSRMKVRAAIKDIVRSLDISGDSRNSFEFADKISKTLDEVDPDISYKEALEASAEFAKYMEKYPEVARHVQQCENILRQMSMHAAGVLISANPLDEELPLMVDKKGLVVTAYDGKTIESLGYLKLDTLGLKNLDIIADCKKHILRLRGSIPRKETDPLPTKEHESITDYNRRIVQDDNIERKLASLAFKYLREKSTLGIFQCEQAVTQDLLRRGEANSIENIADILALIRPGPRKAGSTEVYIERKKGDKPYETWYLYSQEPLPSQIVDDIIEWGPSVAKIYFDKFNNLLESNYLELDKTPDIKLSYTFPKQSEYDELTEAPKICCFLHQLNMLINNKIDIANISDIKPFNLQYLGPICDSTQGLPLFQEQLMQIAVRCAGFSKGESDMLRKAVGKKDQKLIRAMGEKFINGMQTGGELNPGASEFESKYVWYKFILPYGSYGFNLSHSISYAAISYETVWLKANFPGEFYTSLLSHEADQDKINTIISEAKAAGIKFLPPNINKSTTTFTLVDTQTIIYSLTCLKGVGEKAVDKIVNNRPYKNMVDFIGRAGVNSNVTTSLIKGGAFEGAFEEEKVTRKNYFDFFEDCRTKLKRQTERLLKDSLARKFDFKSKTQGGSETVTGFHERMMESNSEYRQIYNFEVQKEINNFQYDWTAPLTVTSKGVVSAVSRESNDTRQQWTLEEHLDFEEEIYGTSISGHRLDPFSFSEKNFISNATSSGLSILDLSQDISIYPKNQDIYIFCLGLRLVKESPYKKDPKQFVRIFEIEDRFAKGKVTVFDKTYTSTVKKDSINPLSIMKKKLPYRPAMIIKCKINEFNGMKNILLDSIVEWVNESDIKQKIQDSKLQELNMKNTKIFNPKTQEHT